MAVMTTQRPRIAGVATCVPPREFDNQKDVSGFAADEIQKFVAMVGVEKRWLADDSVCCSDLCVAAAEKLLGSLGWERDTIDALMMVTHTPDYILPSTACTIQARLGLPHTCACFDVGLGCSGYCYGLWLSSMMLERNRFRRVLLLVGETPARLSHEADRSVALLFGDAGSATALEARDDEAPGEWHFCLHSDGTRYVDFVVEAGGLRKRTSGDERDYFIRMNGANIFNFAIKRVPPLVQEALAESGLSMEDIDYFVFHQANKFIIEHLVRKLKVPMEKVPMTIAEFGNVGGCSVPLTITRGNLSRPADRALRLMLVGYGVGLSWASALVELEPEAILAHSVLGRED